MKLRVTQTVSRNKSNVRFVVNCSLELASQERQLYGLYGAIPLLAPPPHTVPTPVPGSADDFASGAALTPEEVTAFLTPEGCTFEAADVRRALAFVERLKAACRELPGYWKAADQFDTHYTADPMEPTI